MKRILFLIAALGMCVSHAQAAGGFSCQADDKQVDDKQTDDRNVTRLVVEGATPRAERGLINFGAMLEVDNRKIVFKLADVKKFSGRNGIIHVRATAQTGDDIFTISMNARRNPKDENDWAGTYEVIQGVAGYKAMAANAKRGKVKCAVD